jgi:ABC-type multidrug transport system permease subunit
MMLSFSMDALFVCGMRKHHQFGTLRCRQEGASTPSTTHAMRIVRGILLKGNGWSEIAPDLWPIAIFTVVVTAFASWAYRETLD